MSKNGDDDDYDELAIHKTRRKVVRGSITKDLKKTADQLDTVTKDNALEAQVMLSKLETYAQQVSDHDDYILRYGTKQKDVEKEVEGAWEYQMRLSEAATRLKAQLREVDAAAASSARAADSSKGKSPVKTPKLELTSFSGDPLRWQEFWDDFSCSIDCRSDLSIIDKFKILKQSLQGEALSVADGYYLTQTNYDEVKDALKERFGDPQVAIHAHFLALMELKPASHDVAQLVKMRDSCEAHIRSLVALGVSEDTFGVVFAPLVLSKLPKYVRMELNRLNGSNKWTLPKLREMLRVEIVARTRSERQFTGASSKDEGEEKPEKSKGNGSKRSPKGTATTLMVQSDKRSTPAGAKRRPAVCVFCEEGHMSWECTKYATSEARLGQLKGRCFRCFSKDHRVSGCQSNKKCYHCGKTNHNSSICYEKFGRPTKTDSSQLCQSLNPNAPEFVSDSSNAVRDNAAVKANGSKAGIAVLESTNVTIKGTKASATARIVFDTASTTTLIRRKVSRDIGAQPIGDNYTAISRVGERQGKRDKYPRVKLTLMLKDGTPMELYAREIGVVAAPLKLVPLDLREFENHTSFPEVSALNVDKPTDAEIDILLGLDYYTQLVRGEVCRNNSDTLVVKATKVGYILCGYSKQSPWSVPVDHHMLTLDFPDQQTDLPDLERFWRLEDIGVVDKPGLCDDEVALASFNRSIAFDNGRYSVKFPFKSEVPEVPENKALALSRLHSTYRRLEANPELLSAYDQILVDQLGKEVIEPAPDEPSGVVHYLPHHAVLTPGKVTTKVRVVFDASAKSSPSSPSLNDTMFRGPVLLNDLCGLLMRFRLPKRVVSTDVEKAFLQIRLDETHRDCTRFFWLKDTQKPPLADNIIVFRYARVPFGMKASPFLLAATIVHHLRSVGTQRAKAVERCTYMDNIICACRDSEDALECYREVKQLFQQMSMNLREWYSNDAELMAAIPEADRGKSSEPSVLGIRWNHAEDTLHCSVGGSSPVVVTKRTILRFHASLFDPCGWFSAVTVQGKILLQQLWKEKLGWDDPVSPEVSARWKELADDLVYLPSVKLPRRCLYGNARDVGQAGTMQLHAFCDASSRAYAACVYLRSETPDGAQCCLLFAKTRVAPVKQLTIPRLELMAVVICSRILSFVEGELDQPIESKFIWTDSMCVLSWLKTGKVTSVFVENRLKELRKRSDVQFRFVKTHENPADIPTRGMRLASLTKCSAWWNGPVWLTRPPDQWPNPGPASTPVEVNDADVNCGQAVNAVAEETTVNDPVFDLTRYGSLAKLLRVTCYVLMAVKLFKRVKEPGCATVDAKNLQHAQQFWERRIQELHYGRLIEQLKATNGTYDDRLGKWKNFARQLGLYVRADGMLTCRGRFGNSPDISPVSKDPKLLPGHSRFSELIINRFHERVLHSGPKHTLAALRTQYWIPRARSRIRSILLKCPVCRRWEGGPFKVPPVSPLPDFRVSIKRPFSTVGLDYIGPLYVRGDDTPKVWIALFTCASTRAVHLEVVASLSAADFLLALRRFTAIYQNPSAIVSDNASQFKLASQALTRMWQSVMQDPTVVAYSGANGIHWHFITEKAPWMGGFYERLVALVKMALKKTIGTWTLSAVELQTVVYEISNVLNSRPLAYVDDDPSGLVITPAHLLFKAGDIFPDSEEEYDPANCHSKLDEVLLHWRAGQALLRNFWQVWRDHYLLALREHWRPLVDRATSDIRANVGTVVLIKEPLPRGMWKLGKITSLKLSHDGKMRSAEVKLSTGRSVQRPLRLLYPVEVPCDNASDADTTAADPPPAPQRRPQRTASKVATAKIRDLARND
jgi:hypothetical protein